MDAARPARLWVEILARWGFIANGIVYLIVGTLALRWALGAGGRLTDAQGAFRALDTEPFGKPLLIALIPGFFSYALWRLLAAIFDGDRDGNSMGGLLNRAFGMLKGLLYAALGVTALKLAFPASVADSDWVSRVLQGGGGRTIMFIVAASLLTFAGFEMYRALESKLSQGLQLYGATARARRWIVGVSRLGIGGRAIVIAAFAVLLFRYLAAGRSSLPSTQQTFLEVGRIHPAMYIVAGAGIVAYGIYMIVLSRYRRVATS